MSVFDEEGNKKRDLKTMRKRDILWDKDIRKRDKIKLFFAKMFNNDDEG